MPRKQAVIDSHLTPEEQRTLVQRVVESPGFSNSPTIRALFLYIANHAIDGNLDELKEQQIGSQVLRRKPDYNPAEDNIVRVRVRELRHKLDEYFANDGRDESYIITIPKGAYIARFIQRPHDATAEVHSLSDNVQGLKFKQTGLKFSILWVLTGMSLTAVIGYTVASYRQPAYSLPEMKTRNSVFASFWSPLLEKKELTVVAADSGFAFWQDVGHQTIALSDYVNRTYLKSAPTSPVYLEILTRRSTSTADLAAAAKFAEIASQFGGQTVTQFARDLSIQDLRNKNVVLSGSRRSNPWVELFEPKMNFILDYDPNSQGPTFRNKSPQNGEQPKYSIAEMLESQSSARSAIVSYAVVALMPNLSGTGSVLILEGLNMEGSEAALNVVTDQEKLSNLIRRLGRPAGAMTPFEALVKLTAFAGASANIEIVAHRVY